MSSHKLAFNSPSAKKRRHDTLTPATPSPITGADLSPIKGSVPQVTDFKDTDASKASMSSSRINLFKIGSPPEDFITGQDITKWGEFLETLKTFGASVDPLDAVVVRFALAQRRDTMAADKLVFSLLKGSYSPKQVDFLGGVNARFYCRNDVKRGATLLAGKDLVHKAVEKHSFIWALPLAAAWPPPHNLWIGRGDLLLLVL
jgi:hypothetical protein